MATKLVFGKEVILDITATNKKIVSEAIKINPGKTLNFSCESTQDILMKTVIGGDVSEINGKHTSIPNDTTEPILVNFEISGLNDSDLPIDYYKFKSTFDGLPLIVEYLFDTSDTYFIRQNEFTANFSYIDEFPRYSLDGTNFIDFVPNENGELEVTIEKGDRLIIESHPHSLYRVEGYGRLPLNSSSPFSRLISTSSYDGSSSNFLNLAFDLTASTSSTTTEIRTNTNTTTTTTTSTTPGGDTTTNQNTNTTTSTSTTWVSLGNMGYAKAGISEIKVMKWGDTEDLSGQFAFYELVKFYEDVNIDTNNGIKFVGTWANNNKMVDFQLSEMKLCVDLTNAWYHCSGLTSFPSLDLSSVTKFERTWKDCYSLTSFPELNVSNGTNFDGTWGHCRSLTSFPLLDVSSATDFSNAWFYCSGLTSFPDLNASKSTSFMYAWRGCSSLTSFGLVNVSSGTNFGQSWYDCTSLSSFPSLDVSSGTYFRGTWQGCSSLTSCPGTDGTVTIPAGADTTDICKGITNGG